MNTTDENQQQQNSNGKKSKKPWWLIAIGVLAVIIVGVGGYFTLNNVKQMEIDELKSQEQFAGDPEISSQLQIECQKSAERIDKSKDIDAAIAEYKQYADTCRSVYFVIESESPYRNEGMYPDLVIDLALTAAETDKAKAVEVLNFARALNAWEFYLGPVICDSHTVVDAYLESLQMTDEKVCFKKAEYTQQLMSELKNRNFSVLSQTLKNNSVVWVGLPDSDVGCPEKISVITKLVADLTAGPDIVLEANPIDDLESNMVGFIYKSKNEDKVMLEFEEYDSCLQLTAVLVPSMQTE